MIRKILSCLLRLLVLWRRGAASAQSSRPGSRRGSAPIIAARSRSGGRLPKTATPMPRSTSARPIASAAACRPTSRPPRPGSSAPPTRAISTPRRRSACCCSRTATRPGACDGSSAPPSKGEPRALLVYGTALFNGDGVPQDPVLGYAYVSRAAAQGLAPAKETLAAAGQA